jgi:hypothetical protein
VSFFLAKGPAVLTEVFHIFFNLFTTLKQATTVSFFPYPSLFIIHYNPPIWCHTIYPFEKGLLSKLSYEQNVFHIIPLNENEDSLLVAVGDTGDVWCRASQASLFCHIPCCGSDVCCMVIVYSDWSYCRRDS